MEPHKISIMSFGHERVIYILLCINKYIFVYTWAKAWQTSKLINTIFLFLFWNIFCGYSRELSHWGGSFEHPKYMFKLMDNKKNKKICRKTVCISRPYSMCVPWRMSSVTLVYLLWFSPRNNNTHMYFLLTSPWWYWLMAPVTEEKKLNSANWIIGWVSVKQFGSRYTKREQKPGLTLCTLGDFACFLLSSGMQGFRFFSRLVGWSDPWSKNWWDIFLNEGPKHIKLTTIDIWEVYLSYTLTQTLVYIYVNWLLIIQ